jgi:nitrite reductase/ring-hydroxylating ferredoxin subunit/DMSO/TMAO reductase YedYZ heme-binding membrane subunit
MSVSYNAVGWNRQKRIYDAVVAGGVVAFVAVFVGVSVALNPPPREVSAPIVVIRALGMCAIVMLHVILAVGPVCRLDRRFLPMLYNRRHLGVMMFLVALGHAALSTLWYHGFGNVNPALSLLSANTRFDSLSQFPFELLGLAGLLWLFLMAATSHDFWLKNLTPRVWKNQHMGVYVAYGLLVAHVTLGLLQAERSVVFVAAIGAGVAGLTCLHIGAAMRERLRDRYRRVPAQAPAGADTHGWVDVCGIDELPENRARAVCISQGQGDGKPERVAVFRFGGKLSAVSNVCRHQGGPLGEGKVVDGCITCPWHGYQYRPDDGCAPPPFDDKVPTYRVRLTRGRVEIDTRALPPGTPVEPALIGAPCVAQQAPVAALASEA